MMDNESASSIVERASSKGVILPFPHDVMDREIRLALARRLHAITYGYTWLLTGSDIFDSFPKDRSFAIRGENQQAMVVIYEYFKSREARSCALEIRKRSNDSSILTFHSPPDDCPDEYRLLWNEWHEGIIEHLSEGGYWEPVEKRLPPNLETTQPVVKEKGGRKANPGYDAAYDYMITSGLSRDEAFSFWRNKYPEEHLGMAYDVSRKAFNKAFDRRDRKRGG